MANENINQLLQMLHSAEEDVSSEKEKQVMIEGAVDLRRMCDYAVTCSYADVVLIICMLRDYIKTLDEIRTDLKWEVYYRGKFMDMADRLSKQIEYDYDAAVEKCKKKLEQTERTDDYGEEAMILATKRGAKKKNEKG